MRHALLLQLTSFVPVTPLTTPFKTISTIFGALLGMILTILVKILAAAMVRVLAIIQTQIPLTKVVLLTQMFCTVVVYLLHC